MAEFILEMSYPSKRNDLSEMDNYTGLDINPVPRKILAQNLSSFDYRIIRLLVYRHIFTDRNSARF